MSYPVEVLDACPNCGSSGVLWKQPGEGHFVECNTSGSCARTDCYEKIEDAVKAWNERRLI